MLAPRTEYVSTTLDVEIRPPKGGRKTLAVENHSGNDVYMAFDTIADSENGMTLTTGGVREWAFDGTQSSVPQGNIWLRGSQAARQKVIIRQA